MVTAEPIDFDPQTALTEARLSISAVVGVLRHVYETTPRNPALLSGVGHLETGLLWLREAVESAEDGEAPPRSP